MGTGEPNAVYTPPRRPLDPFRRAVLRGLAILLPPLLTIVIFLWVGNTVAHYLLVPMENAARWVIVEKVADIRTPDKIFDREVVLDKQTYLLKPSGVVTIDETAYHLTAPPDNQLIPQDVYEYVAKGVGTGTMPTSAKAIYTWYVDHKWLPRRFVVPVFLCLFVLVLYSLGKFLAAGVGRFFWMQLERIIHRLPLVRNVYASVKQVTDFMITDPDIEYARVVAVQYPRKGIWTVAFVTGESMLEIRDAASEPVLSVLVPTSPMPFTGFTITVKKSETVDLDISIEQAFQFIISCGVVVPPQQIADAAAKQAAGRSEKPLAISAPVGDDD